MKTVQPIGALTFSAGILLAIGCSHEEPPATAPGTTAPQGAMKAQNAADERVVQSVAGARCDHEQTCNNVGNDKSYATRSLCMEKMHSSLANDLNAYDCPHGIDESGLEHCLTAIRAESCGFSFDTLSREHDCRSGALCLK